MANNGQHDEGLTTSFYRIIMPSVIRERRLVFPRKFADVYGDHLSNSVKLSVPRSGGGRGAVNCYCIGLKRSDGLLYLCVGWENFMKDYSIRFGYFLLFIYKGNSEFDLHIFDLTAHEIQYPRIDSCSDVNVKLEDEYAEDEGANIVTSGSSRTKRKRVVDPAIEAAKMYKTENPFFIVTLRGYSIKHMLYLPRTFTREHMSNDYSSSEFIEIQDSDNKKWPMRLVKHDDRDWTILSAGWTQFVKAKGLKIGDVCVFELIETSLMKVSVFHAEARKRPRVLASVDAAEMYKTENPFFIVTLKDYNVNKNMLYLPRTFTKEHMNNVNTSDFIEIVDSRGMRWPVRIIRMVNDHYRIMLSTGWIQVVKAQRLKTGDVCVFELTEAAVMKVSVSQPPKLNNLEL